MAGLTAVVFGATGAIGEALVQQLVTHASVGKVVTVGRRPVGDVPADRTAQLVQVTVNMDNLESEAKEACQGANVVFCALGTTRAVAGSADAFKKVDYEYVAASARLARACGVAHYSLVSAQGANHKCPANDLRIFHGLLYTKTKGMAEQAALAQGFQRVSIFRPGLLDRGAKARGVEKMYGNIVPSIHVQDVARLMILDALREPSTAKPVAFFAMKDLRTAAQTVGQAPTPSQ